MFATIQQIYDQLQDDMSRKIFMSRLEYSVTNDVNVFRKLFDCIGLSKIILEKINLGQRIVVFGAGAHGQRLVEQYPECNWVAFCDNDFQLGGGYKVWYSRYFGKRVKR